MDIVKYAIGKPVSIAVAVIIIVMFGLIGLNSLPVQLTPDVETPQITVSTVWPGATPYDIEKEIIENQEEVLKGLKNLDKMESSSFNSYGEITLTFQLETDISDALLRVSNKMNEVSNYPENVDKPVISASGAQSSPVIWTVMKSKKDNPESILHYKTFFENNVRQYIERVEGVGSLLVFGGTEDELHIVIDPDRMALHNVTTNQIIAAIQNSNRNTSAGVLGMGRKNYRIRTVSLFQSPQEALDVVIYDDGLKRIYLKDVADVTRGYAVEDSSIMHNTDEVIVMGVRKEQGANVLKMTDKIEIEIDRLNKEILEPKGLYLDMVYNQRPYINRAINLVKQNVLVGGVLAIIVLLVFLRSLTSTITTALAIPISAIGTFIFMWLMGRNLNVVSLAGISFAVGMLVDNAIVVLENIDRHRKMGKKAFQAAYDGAQEVRGAVFASTATTVAVFLPVIFIQEEAGQLFRDIAIAITFSILLSLFVSISVIPSVIHQFYKRKKIKKAEDIKPSKIGSFLTKWLITLSNFSLKNVMTRVLSIVIFTLFAISISWWLMPNAEYLPQGNQNLILNILIPPPGNSIEKYKEVGRHIYKELDPYYKEDFKDGMPQLKDVFYVGAERFNIFGAISQHETRANEMIPTLMRIMNSIPGMFGVSIQSGIFENGIGAGRSIDVNISGESMDDIVTAARTLFGTIGAKIQGAQTRPIPSLETSYPEVNIYPNKEKLAANGLSEADLGLYVDILMDGRKIEEYRPEGAKQIDMVIKGDDNVYITPEDILNSPIVSNYGNLIRLADVSKAEYSSGMPQINHLERDRTITLQVTPPKTIPLQTAMDIITKDVVGGLQQAGQLNNVKIEIGGNADKLVETMNALQWNLLLALAITYLLMAALFENFLYPFIIMFSVPLAAAGGFFGLKLANILIAPQGFDVLTMLGFIILIGTVVNNAILIVHQSLNNVRYNGLVGIAAISDSVRTRIRPIFMSTTTSVLGMLPLAISTGAGSELYRGLGSVLLGGLIFSTIFTLFVIPALLSFFIKFERSRTNETA